MEYEFSESQLTHVRSVVGEATGIMLPNHKTEMVKGRLARRLRALGLHHIDDYIALLNDPSGDELQQCINALTTNVTSFLREPKHFEFLKGTFMKSMMLDRRRSRHIRIWSAACSTGEEPYSIAMSILSGLPHESIWDFQVHASDIDTNVLSTAAAGVYPNESVKDLPDQLLKRWFCRGNGAQEGMVRVRDELRAAVRFRPLNLVENWTVGSRYDAVFCRNVIIYFDRETQIRLFDRLADVLNPGGLLFIGHSESLNGISDRFRPLGNTIYELRS